MPDRFDLMNEQDLEAAFRFSRDYCRLVNPELLHQSAVVSLLRGAHWMKTLDEIVERWDEGGAIDLAEIDNPPPEPDTITSATEALRIFRETNEALAARIATACRQHWNSSRPTSRGTAIQFHDVARHAARVSNSTSVDRTWLW